MISIAVHFWKVQIYPRCKGKEKGNLQVGLFKSLSANAEGTS